MSLAFVPMANASIYSATKAALHSFNLSLHYHLTHNNIISNRNCPPAVNTDLGRPELHTFGAPLPVFADAFMQRVANSEEEIGYVTSEFTKPASHPELQEVFGGMNP